MDVSVIVPFFNEIDNVDSILGGLLPVIDKLRSTRSVEVVFVDDGSADGSAEALERGLGFYPDCVLLRHGKNRGLGAALRTGFEQATGDFVITTDSDATYPFDLIPRLLEQLRPGVDIVTASCYHPQGGVENVPTYRIVLSRSASLMYRVLLDRDIHTYTCMFRAYRRSVIDSVPFQSDGFLAVTELLAKAMLRGFRVAELPCTLRVRRYGVSKAKIKRTIQSHLGFQLQLVKMRASGRLLPREPVSSNPEFDK